MVESFITAQNQQNKEFMNQNIHINGLITQLGTKLDSVITHNKMLETQISQVAQQQATQTTPGGQFPGQPQPNPKGHANAIALWSGATYDEPVNPRLNKQEPPKKNVVTTPEKQVEEPVEPEKQKEEEVKDKEGEKDTKVYILPPPYKPPIPFPQRLKQTKLDNQYKKFVKVIEKLHVEIPFTEAITQIPSYTKFLKDILTNKRRLDDPKSLECNSTV
ncbi:uncharacterized protein LOC127102238 [Lathyrus oleraceus]|uniref:uncharacterized protein LOC127102238 n=1 Tax=Pisum sativum TaxID=3888 RepID=UPI0021CF91DD|nr:uncharacterized protein LOC127102238 [Pisum sativum]